jgi:hypothetical protein
MISFVNGFLCTCSCDVAKAKRNVDPHPRADDAGKPQQTRNGMPGANDPAVVFGGSLREAASATGVTPASAAQAPAYAQLQTRSVDLLV